MPGPASILLGYSPGGSLESVSGFEALPKGVTQ